jgi:hypothetical protein
VPSHIGRFVVALSLTIACLAVFALRAPLTPDSSPGRSLGNVAQAAGGTTRVYLPFVVRADPVSQQALPGLSRFGVRIGRGDAAVIDQLATSGARWTRIMLLWSSVEPTKGSYSFAAYDDELRRLQSANVQVILEIRRNPAWAAPTICGPKRRQASVTGFVTSSNRLIGKNTKLGSIKCLKYLGPFCIAPNTWGIIIIITAKPKVALISLVGEVNPGTSPSQLAISRYKNNVIISGAAFLPLGPTILSI